MGLGREASDPVRRRGEEAQFGHVRRLYQKLDAVVGDLVDRYGRVATIIVISRPWLRQLRPAVQLELVAAQPGLPGPRASARRSCGTSTGRATAAYGLGINGLYLNMKGRERDGIVEPGDQREALLVELKDRLESITDGNGQRVIRASIDRTRSTREMRRPWRLT